MNPSKEALKAAWSLVIDLQYRPSHSNTINDYCSAIVTEKQRPEWVRAASVFDLGRFIVPFHR